MSLSFCLGYNVFELGLSIVIELDDDTVFWADWIIRGLTSVENTLNVVPSSFLRHLDAPGEIIMNQLS